MRRRLELSINNQIISAFAAHGVQILNEPFEFKIQTVLNSVGAPRIALKESYHWLNSKAILKIIGNDGSYQLFSGYVAKVRPRALYYPGGYYIDVIIRSIIYKQKLRGGARVFINKSVIEIVSQLFADQNGLNNFLQFHLTKIYQPYPFVLQVMDESNLDFINRITAKEGIYWWTGIESELNETFHFSDISPNNAPHSEIGRISIVRSHSAEAKDPEFVGIHHFKMENQCLSTEIVVSEYNDQASRIHANYPVENKMEKARLNQETKKDLVDHYYGSGSVTQQMAEKEAMNRGHYAQSTQKFLIASGNVPTLSVGHLCDIAGKHYFVKKITHEVRPHDGILEPEMECLYSNIIEGIPSYLPYAPLMSDHRITPPIMKAHVESVGDYATLDTQGNYKIRLNCDLSARPKTEASSWVRRIQMTGGSISTNGLEVGLHSPLYDGTEVLIGFLQNDPNRPFIMGSIPNKNNCSPVTKQNQFENIWRTKANNELKISDNIGKEAIKLTTYSDLNSLTLSGTANNHNVTLECQQGVLSVMAQRDILLKALGEINERIGNEKLEEVKLDHVMSTKQGDIHFQANQNITLRANQSIEIKSQKKIHMQAGERWSLKVGSSLILSEENDICLDVEKGKLLINVHALTIQGTGKGNIEWSQANNRAGFRIDREGNIIIFGNQVVLEGSQIDIVGTVESQTNIRRM